MSQVAEGGMKRGLCVQLSRESAAHSSGGGSQARALTRGILSTAPGDLRFRGDIRNTRDPYDFGKM